MVFIKVLLDLLGNGGACDSTGDVGRFIIASSQIYGIIEQANKNDLRTEAGPWGSDFLVQIGSDELLLPNYMAFLLVLLTNEQALFH